MLSCANPAVRRRAALLSSAGALDHWQPAHRRHTEHITGLRPVLPRPEAPSQRKCQKAPVAIHLRRRRSASWSLSDSTCAPRGGSSSITRFTACLASSTLLLIRRTSCDLQRLTGCWMKPTLGTDPQNAPSQEVFELYIAAKRRDSHATRRQRSTCCSESARAAGAWGSRDSSRGVSDAVARAPAGRQERRTGGYWGHCGCGGAGAE